MSISDPIADALAKIRNAIMSKHQSVDVWGTNMIMRILEVLKQEGYIADIELLDAEKQTVKKEPVKVGKKVRVMLKYSKEMKSAIHGIKRISKPSRRIYVSSQDIPSVRNNLGVMIVSTSVGVVTGKYAKSRLIGGELICSVW